MLNVAGTDSFQLRTLVLQYTPDLNRNRIVGQRSGSAFGHCWQWSWRSGVRAFDGIEADEATTTLMQSITKLYHQIIISKKTQSD